MLTAAQFDYLRASLSASTGAPRHLIEIVAYRAGIIVAVLTKGAETETLTIAVPRILGSYPQRSQTRHRLSANKLISDEYPAFCSPQNGTTLDGRFWGENPEAVGELVL